MIFICFIYTDFSLDNLLSNKGLSLSLDKLTSEVTLQLLNKLGVTPFLLDSQCNRDKEPYIPVKDRWNNGNLIGKLFSGTL
jgi:hypothetical protein